MINIKYKHLKLLTIGIILLALNSVPSVAAYEKSEKELEIAIVKQVANKLGYTSIFNHEERSVELTKGTNSINVKTNSNYDFQSMLKKLEKMEEVIRPGQDNSHISTQNPSGLRYIELGEDFKFRKNVYSEEVRELRYFFLKKGYSIDTEIYSYDSSLMEIVKKYQQLNSLVVDGYAGVSTLEVINNDIRKNNIYIPNLTLKSQDVSTMPKGDWVIINKESNTLYYVNNREVKNKYHIATGSSPSKTPEGKFKIVTKLVNPYWGGASGKFKPVQGGAPNNPLGTRWMGIDLGGGGIYGIHGNSSSSSIGKYVSMGCIRMYNKEAEELYKIIEKGTPVWIGSAEKLKEYGIVVGWKNN